MDTIRYEGDQILGTEAAPYLEALQKRYPDRASWGQAVVARLRSWGFNTIGAWSDSQLTDLDMPYTVILDIAGRAGANWQRGRPADVFDPHFEETARKITQEECGHHVQSPLLIGYFSDNELRWGARLARHRNDADHVPGASFCCDGERARHHFSAAQVW